MMLETKNNTATGLLVSTAFALMLLITSPSLALSACPSPEENSLVTVNENDDCTIPSESLYRVDVATGENSNTDGNAINITGGLLTINNTATLRMGGTLTLNGGSLSFQDGGVLSIGPSWIIDGDADNWALNFNSGSYSNSTVSGSRRLGLMSSTSVADCNDNAFSLTNTCYAYSQGTYWAYSYSQGTYWRYTYAQSAYWTYGYGQSTYWRYAYGQAGYWRYAYGQAGYWRYTYSQSGYPQPY